MLPSSTTPLAHGAINASGDSSPSGKTSLRSSEQPAPASGANPFGAADCNTQPQIGTFNLNSEVEPWLDVDPTSADDTDGPDFIGVYQQDRYSDGGARGLGTSVSTDGGANFSILPRDELPNFTQCVGNELYERATDPWVSFGPNSDAHQISLSFNNTENLDNAILVSKSPAGSTHRQWSAPITLKRDTNPAVFNDKESITADQNNANYVYAVWDRLVFPNERTHGKSYLNTAAFRGPTWFSRTTNGGSSWETARPIFDPGQNAMVSRAEPSPYCDPPTGARAGAARSPFLECRCIRIIVAEKPPTTADYQATKYGQDRD